MAKWDGLWAGIGDGAPGHLAAERNPQNRPEQLRIAALSGTLHAREPAHIREFRAFLLRGPKIADSMAVVAVYGEPVSSTPCLKRRLILPSTCQPVDT